MKVDCEYRRRHLRAASALDEAAEELIRRRRQRHEQGIKG